MNSLDIKQKYTQKTIDTINLHSKKDIENMLNIAHNLNKTSSIKKYERIQILHNIAKLIEEEKGNFASLIANEGGKPIKDAKVEVDRAIEGIYIALSHLRVDKTNSYPLDTTKAGDNKLAFSIQEPIGIVVAISAFNHPLNLIIHQVIPAIATNCPIIIKPSLKTPLCCIKFASLCKKANLPDGWLQVALVQDELSQQLATDKKVSFFSFIGSSKVGWMLKSKLSNGTRCALEHGGVAPLIIDTYKDIDRLLEGIIKSGFYHSGQVCVSLQKIFVEKNQEKDIANLLSKKANKLKVGDSINEDTDIGPLININELDRIDNWVKEALDEGATLICGGKRINNICYEPTILLNPDIKSKVSQEEIFAPVICIYGYDDINDAINIANSLEVSFQSSIFSDNIKVAFNVAKKLKASSVMINDFTTFRVDDMPFAGRKNSGYGVGGIGYTMNDMSENKMIVIGE
jgi:acyl-CoA reductase-like NAD-dependent aldehyde dehydrogenase